LCFCSDLTLSLNEGLGDFLDGKLEGNVGRFKKINKREAYPPDPIPLKDSDGVILAEIEVMHFTVFPNRTEGCYKINRYLSGDSRQREIYQEQKGAIQDLLTTSVRDCLMPPS